LGLSDAKGVFFLAVIDFDLPAVEVDLKQGLGVVDEVGGKQISGVAVIELAALAFAVGCGRDDDDAQGLFAHAPLPIDRIDLLVAHDALFASVEDMGWVNVGCDSDTASFAIESIRRWWRGMGKRLYPEAKGLLICADRGGSNGYRLRLWKVELQNFADEIAMPITVCHFPPGTSKWNKVEHRLFSFISMNWRGQPLVSHEVVVNLIGSTKTRSGLRVKARLDKKTYPTKVRISDEEMKSLSVPPHKFHGDWNYTVNPT
jgi:hypothetical protein